MATDNRPHADNCRWALGNQSCECGYYWRENEKAKRLALEQGPLQTAYPSYRHTADLDRAHQAGWNEAIEAAATQASIHVVDVYTFGLHTHSATGLPDLVKLIRAMRKGERNETT